MKGYLTLTEAAAKFNLTSRMLSSYCKEGRIEGAERAGNMWLIPETAELPKDKRIRSGNYIGWRKKYSGKYRRSTTHNKKEALK